MAKIKTSPKLKSQVPTGALKDKWDNHKFNLKLVNPANKRNFCPMVLLNNKNICIN